MIKDISVIRYTLAKNKSITLEELDLDKTYNLYSRWGRYGKPDIRRHMQIQPEDCWTTQSVRVWVFGNSKYQTVGYSPESYLEDWFLTE